MTPRDELQVRFTNAADKQLGRLDSSVRRRVIRATEALAAEPFPSGCRRVVETHEPVWRIRVGDWRLLYAVLNQELVVLVVRIDQRGHAYSPLASVDQAVRQAREAGDRDHLP